jgi:hypothetical protein
MRLFSRAAAANFEARSSLRPLVRSVIDEPRWTESR